MILRVMFPMCVTGGGWESEEDCYSRVVKNTALCSTLTAVAYLLTQDLALQSRHCELILTLVS